MPISAEYYDYLKLQRAKLLSQTERFLTNTNCFSQERQNVLDWVNSRLDKYNTILDQFKWMNTEISGSSSVSSVSSGSSLDTRSRSGSINSSNSFGSNHVISIST